MIYIFPYVFSLVFWIIFFTAVNAPGTAWYAFLALVIWFVIAIFFIGRKYVFRAWALWMNFFLFCISTFGIILIVMSEVTRNFYIVIAGLLAGLLVYAMSTYFRLGQSYSSRVYLELISFVYLLTFWQVLTVLFFFIISYDFSAWTAVPLVFVIAFLLGKGISEVQNTRLKAQMTAYSLLSLTTAQFFLVLELLPLHHLVLATLLTIWFFFVVEISLRNRDGVNRRLSFKKYFIAAVVAMALVMLTSRWG